MEFVDDATSLVLVVRFRSTKSPAVHTCMLGKHGEHLIADAALALNRIGYDRNRQK